MASFNRTAPLFHPLSDENGKRDEHNEAYRKVHPMRFHRGFSRFKNARTKKRLVLLRRRGRLKLRLYGSSIGNALANEERRCTRDVRRGHRRSVENAPLLAFVFAIVT